MDLSDLLSKPQTCFKAFEIADPPKPNSSDMYGGEIEFVASHTYKIRMSRLGKGERDLTAGKRLEGSASMRTRKQLTSVSTILMRLWVLLTSTKHLVNSA